MTIETAPDDWDGTGSLTFRLVPNHTGEVFTLTGEPWTWRHLVRRRYWLCGLADHPEFGPTDPPPAGAG